MNKQLFEKYAGLKSQEKEVKAAIVELGAEIKGEIEGAGVDKVSSDFGTFSLEGRKTWKYSDAVVKLQEKEKAEGTATFTESTNLRFYKPKPQEEVEPGK